MPATFVGELPEGQSQVKGKFSLTYDEDTSIFEESHAVMFLDSQIANEDFIAVFPRVLITALLCLLEKPRTLKQQIKVREQ